MECLYRNILTFSIKGGLRIRLQIKMSLKHILKDVCQPECFQHVQVLVLMQGRVRPSVVLNLSVGAPWGGPHMYDYGGVPKVTPELYYTKT